MTKTLTILGSTGSVGTATMDVVAANPDLFEIQALTAHKNVSLLAQQAKAAKAKLAVIGDEALYNDLKSALNGTGIEAAAGRRAVMDAASIPVDCMMAAIVGMAGLEPILAALKHSRAVAIANKEPLVAAGELVLKTAKESGAVIIPVDSEHNAIFQVMETANKDSVRRIILTASGGPFREWTSEQMRDASVEQALAHPNWSMGNKISIDSATMMNKALEVIEAHHLFTMPPEKIDVVLHPQSVVHSMVEYEDGSVLAQMGASDMRVPVTHALGWPNRIAGPAKRLDFTKMSQLTFENVDSRRFPAINHAYDCLKDGQAACAALNAANEVAVEAFLQGDIGFLDIVETARKTVAESDRPRLDDLESILAFDEKMRKAAKAYILNR